MPVKRRLTLIADRSHAWLSVSLSDLVKLGIADDITPYSFVSGQRAYLEEDIDAGIYLRAANAAGWDVEYRPSVVDRTPITSYGSYHPYWAHNPLRDGSVVHVPSVGKDATVHISGGGSTRLHATLAMHGGDNTRYGLPLSTAYRYVAPPGYTGRS